MILQQAVLKLKKKKEKKRGCFHSCQYAYNIMCACSSHQKGLDTQRSVTEHH